MTSNKATNIEQLNNLLAIIKKVDPNAEVESILTTDGKARWVIRAKVKASKKPWKGIKGVAAWEKLS